MIGNFPPQVDWLDTLLLGILTLIFFIINIAPEVIEQMRRNLGLD